MNRQLHDLMIAQYATPKVSGNGLVSWDGGVKCVLPSVKLLGAAMQETLTGKNLFDKSSGYVRGYIDKTINKFVAHTNFATVQMPIDASTQYTAQKASGWRFIVADGMENLADGIDLTALQHDNKATQLTFTTSASAKYLYITIWYKSEDTLSIQEILDSIQVEKGSTATAYEPYCGGIPAPNPGYPIMPVCNDGVVVGRSKNLLNLGNISNFNGTETDNPGEYYYNQISDNTVWVVSNMFPIDVPNGTYTFSAKIKCRTSTTLLGVGIAYEDGTYEYGNRSSSTEYFVSSVTSKDGKKIIGIGFIYGKNGAAYVKDFQFERGDTATPYTPYWDGGQATAPELWAIPGTDIRDEWDSQTGKGIRRVGKKVFDGLNAYDIKFIRSNGDYGYFRFQNIQNKCVDAYAFCDYYPVNDIDENWYNPVKSAIFPIGITSIPAYLPFIHKGITNIDDYMTWLSNHPVTVWYALADPEPFYHAPARLTQPNGPGQIIQVSGSVPECPIEASYLTHS